MKRIPPVFQGLATRLARLPELRYIKIFSDRIAASNVLSANGKKNPVVQIGAEDIVGVELLIDVPNKILQFYALASATKGCGRRMVDAVVGAAPEGWFLAVPMDWSGGFWNRLAQELPRLSVGCVLLLNSKTPATSWYPLRRSSLTGAALQRKSLGEVERQQKGKNGFDGPRQLTEHVGQPLPGVDAIPPTGRQQTEDLP